MVIELIRLTRWWKKRSEIREVSSEVENFLSVFNWVSNSLETWIMNEQGKMLVGILWALKQGKSWQL